MTHLHSDQCNVPVYQHPVVFTPYQHLVNAQVSPLNSNTSGFIPRHYSESPTVIDGEVITSNLTTPTLIRWGDTVRITAGHESKRSLLRRAIEDPYWIVMGLTVVLGLSIMATAVYGVIQITLAIGSWFHAHGATLGAIAALIIALMFCGGATAAKCTGIHCGGVQRLMQATHTTAEHAAPGVKPALAAKRRTRPVVENHDYAAFARRVIRAQAHRIADGDIEELAYLFGVQRELHQAIHTAIAGLRAQGYSWADIALRLGITRQAAYQRWAATEHS